MPSYDIPSANIYEYYTFNLSSRLGNYIKAKNSNIYNVANKVNSIHYIGIIYLNSTSSKVEKYKQLNREYILNQIIK